MAENWQGIPFHLTIWYEDPVFMLYPYLEFVWHPESPGPLHE